MENNFSTETFEYKTSNSGSASVLFVMSILGLAAAFFTVALPGAGDQLMTDACNVMHCNADSGAGSEPAYAIAGSSRLGNTSDKSAITFIPRVEAAEVVRDASPDTMPMNSALSTADQHYQIAAMFNADLDRNAAQHATQHAARQPELIVSADVQRRDTPLAFLADAVPAMP